MVTRTPIFARYQQDVKTIAKTNFHHYFNNNILFQLGDDRLQYPIVFFSKNLNYAECNHKIYDKELLDIIKCF